MAKKSKKIEKILVHSVCGTILEIVNNMSLYCSKCQTVPLIEEVFCCLIKGNEEKKLFLLPKRKEETEKEEKKVEEKCEFCEVVHKAGEACGFMRMGVFI